MRQSSGEATWNRAIWQHVCSCVSISSMSIFCRISLMRLWLQSDNAPKELRNSHSSRILCMLTQSGHFNLTSHNHLMVGHTHEDVDGVLSLVTTALRSQPVLETPRDVIRTLEDRLRPIIAKHNMEFGVELLDTVLCLNCSD